MCFYLYIALLSLADFQYFSSVCAIDIFIIILYTLTHVFLASISLSCLGNIVGAIV